MNQNATATASSNPTRTTSTISMMVYESLRDLRVPNLGARPLDPDLFLRVDERVIRDQCRADAEAAAAYALVGKVGALRTVLTLTTGGCQLEANYSASKIQTLPAPADEDEESYLDLEEVTRMLDLAHTLGLELLTTDDSVGRQYRVA